REPPTPLRASNKERRQGWGHGGNREVSSVLSAVAALELLARAAPARVVPAELVVLGGDALRRSRDGLDKRLLPAERGCDRVGAGQRVVLVREAAVRRLGLGEVLELLRLLGRDLRVEEREHDLLADRRVQLLEHLVAL